MRTGWKSILIVIAVAAVLSLPYDHRWNLLMHIVGAIVFMGNIVVSAVWMSMARRSGEPANLRFAARGVLVADVYLTTPGVVLLFINGLIMSFQWFEAGAAGWLHLSMGLFVLSGIAWLTVLGPIQRKLARLAAAGAPGDDLPDEFQRGLKAWFRWGGILTLLPIVTLVLMVLKPALWQG
jgi:uncharacterized membrane protein